MKKSILILGMRATGKTTLLKKLLKECPTEFAWEEIRTIEEMEEKYLEATAADSFCILTSLHFQKSDLPASILEMFEVHQLESVY